MRAASSVIAGLWLLPACAAAVEPPSSGPLVVEPEEKPGTKLVFWLETSLKRVFPRTPPADRHSLNLLSARNAKVSFQACFQNRSTNGVTMECAVAGQDDLLVLVRRVGYVPMWNHTAGVPMQEHEGVGLIPGLVPDPLFPEQRAVVGPSGTQAFWITVTVPKDARVGLRHLTVRMKPSDSKTTGEMDVRLDVRPLVIQPRKDFPVTHWWNADGIYDWYKVPPFGDEWFKLTEPYLANMVSHGSNMLLVPLFHIRREVVERPAQLLKVTCPAPGRYEFDWTNARKFVALARRCGFEYFEWPHLWHMTIRADGFIRSAAEPQRVYLSGPGKPSLIVPSDYPATGPDYLTFLKQFLPEFHKFLREEKLLDVSYFHVSDEPGGAEEDINNYRAVRKLLGEMAPWTNGRVLDAMSDLRYGKLNLIDYPVPNVAAAQEYLQAGIPHWVYYCCGPRGQYLNRFFDTPLVKIRMSGWLFYRLKALGFLHWGYNFWYVMDLGLNPVPQKLIDPFTDGAAGTTSGGEGEPYGDSFVVYPGENGPISSIRWEVFAESLQDYALLQTAGVKHDDPVLASLKSYADFPRTEEWITAALNKVLSAPEQAE